MAGAAAMEKEAFGFFCFCSPFQQYESLLGKYKAKRVSDLSEQEDGDSVVVMGLLTAAKVAKSKAGRAYGKCSFEDDNRKLELMIFDYVLAQFQPHFEREGALVLEARVRMDGDMLSLNATKFLDFITPEQARGTSQARPRQPVLKLRLTHEQVAGETLAGILKVAHHHAGRDPWRIIYSNGDGNHVLEISNKHWVAISTALLGELTRLLGKEAVDYS